jgi:hypothetical protein
VAVFMKLKMRIAVYNDNEKIGYVLLKRTVLSGYGAIVSKEQFGSSVFVGDYSIHRGLTIARKCLSDKTFDIEVM